MHAGIVYSIKAIFVIFWKILLILFERRREIKNSLYC